MGLAASPQRPGCRYPRPLGDCCSKRTPGRHRNDRFRIAFDRKLMPWSCGPGAVPGMEHGSPCGGVFLRLVQAGGFELVGEAAFFFGREFPLGRADGPGIEAPKAHPFLESAEQLAVSEDAAGIGEPDLGLPGGGKVASLQFLINGLVEIEDDVGCARDRPAGAGKEGLKSVLIGAVEYLEALGRVDEDAREVLHVARAVLDAGDVVHFIGQADDELGGEGVAGIARDVIKENGKAGGGACDGAVELLEGIVVVLVIAGRRDACGVGAGVGGVGREFGDGGRIESAGMGNDGHAAVGGGVYSFKKTLPLVYTQQQAFASGAANEEPVCSALNEPMDEGADAIVIDGFTVLSEGRHHCGKNAAEFGRHRRLLLLIRERLGRGALRSDAAASIPRDDAADQRGPLS